MIVGPYRLRPHRSKLAEVRALVGFLAYARPLSAQAQMPSRPSGGDKEQEPAKNEGSIGPGLAGPRTIASDWWRIAICILIGPRSRRSVKAALNLEAAALLDDGAHSRARASI